MNQSVCAAPTKQPTNERKMMAVRALAGAESVSVLAAIARAVAVPDYLVRATCLLHRKPDTSDAF